MGLLVVLSPQSKDYLPPFMPGRQWIIYTRPPSTPTVAFHGLQGEGGILLPRSSTGTFYLDLRLEAGNNFPPF